MAVREVNDKTDGVMDELLPGNVPTIPEISIEISIECDVYP